ncbi:hypothetical protein LJC26_03110 [Desulfovibrio sp. OttesenSCG-928-O18]|nr:hypothetical protein [Desulfovibrio sp. OttesenSCG-928-O18]
MAASPKLVNAAWWAVYFAVGLGLQLHFPGVDALIPGIMLSCQEQRGRQTIWLCCIAILVQEGTGSLAFGSSLLWYGSLLLIFFIGRLFFVTGSLFFVVLIALVLGMTHSALLYVTSSLQGFQVDTYRLAEQAMAQALLIPPLYAVASLFRKRFLNYEYGI